MHRKKLIIKYDPEFGKWLSSLHLLERESHIYIVCTRLHDNRKIVFVMCVHHIVITAPFDWSRKMNRSTTDTGTIILRMNFLYLGVLCLQSGVRGENLHQPQLEPILNILAEWPATGIGKVENRVLSFSTIF